MDMSDNELPGKHVRDLEEEIKEIDERKRTRKKRLDELLEGDQAKLDKKLAEPLGRLDRIAKRAS